MTQKKLHSKNVGIGKMVAVREVNNVVSCTFPAMSVWIGKWEVVDEAKNADFFIH
jgi:hypothetical protein